MTPLSFDNVTAREIVGDSLARSIEAKARADADAGEYSPPVKLAATYWDNVVVEMHRAVYFEQWRKRIERNARKAAGGINQ